MISIQGLVDALEEPAEIGETEKHPVTVRLDSLNLFFLDKLAAKYGFSRSAFLSELSTTAVRETVARLGIEEEFAAEFFKVGESTTEEKS